MVFHFFLFVLRGWPLCSVPLGRPAASASCPPGTGWSPLPPPPRSPGGRRAAAVPWAARTTCTSGACSGAAPGDPPPVTQAEQF